MIYNIIIIVISAVGAIGFWGKTGDENQGLIILLVGLQTLLYYWIGYSEGLKKSRGEKNK